MKFVVSTKNESFFDGVPYPFDLDAVEERDGFQEAVKFVTAIVGPPPAVIMDLGCGYGRHVKPLSLLGYEVIGIEYSRCAVVRTKARAPNSFTIQADTALLPLAESTVDVAISLYSSIGYAAGSAQRTIQEARRVLRSGGKMVVDLPPPRKRFLEIGIERVPRGVAGWVRWKLGGYNVQRNIVLSRNVSGLYGLKYEAFDRHKALALFCRDSWTRHRVLNVFDVSNRPVVSGRLIVIAEKR